MVYVIVGGAVASWLLCSSPDLEVRARGLSVPLSTQVYICVPANLRANAQKYREKGGHGQNLTNLCFEFKERY